MDMDIQESKARRHNERLFFETDLEAARRSNDSDKARHEAEQALEYAAARGIIDRIPKSVLPMVAEMIIDEDGYAPDPLLGEGEREGWSPLHLAVDRDRIDVARALLDHGANIDALAPNYFAMDIRLELSRPERPSVTPLHFACGGGRGGYYSCNNRGYRLAAARLLVERGANLSARTDKGDTPLRLAIANGKADRATCAKLVELFLAHGAPVDEVRHSQTLLHDAASLFPAIDVVRLLVAHGAELDSRGWEGKTPLACACQRPSSLEILKCLVENGADIDLANDHGRTPLHYAMDSRNGADNARWLLMRGAAFDSKDMSDVDEYGPLSPRNMNFHILTDDLRLALWRRLKLYAFGKPSKYTTSAQHRVAGLPELSHHIGAFLILRPLDQVLTAPEKAAVLQAIAELDTAATRVTVRRLAESIVGLPEGALDAKKPSINEVWTPQGGYTTLAVSNV